MRVGGSGRVLAAMLALCSCDELTASAESSDAEAKTEAAKGEGEPAAPEPKPTVEAKPEGEGAKPQPAAAELEDSPNLAAADGPKVAWSTAFTSAPTAVSIAGDGTLVVVFEDRTKGYLGGAQRWEKQGSFRDLLRMQDGTLAVSAGPAVVAFAPATGEQVFRVEITGKPRAGGDRKGTKEVAAAEVAAMTVLGSQILVATTDATFHVIDPPACAAKQPSCLRPAGVLEGEYLERKASLAASDDGTRFLVEDASMRAFDLGLDLAFEVEASGRIAAAVPVSGGRLAVSYGGAVALLDVAGCIGKGTVHVGATAGPKGCGLWRYGSELDPVAPGVVDRDTLAVNGERRLQAVTRGTDSWKTPIGAIGRVIAGEGGTLYTMCMEDVDDGAAMSVKAIDAEKGTASWVVGLPFAPAQSALVVTEALRFDQQGGFIVAGWEENAAVLSIPTPRAEADVAAPKDDAGSPG